MNKKAWSMIGLAGIAVVAVVKAVLDKAAEKVVDQYYPTEGMGGFVTFLAAIPSWFMQAVSVPLLVLILLGGGLIAALGYIAWKRIGQKSSDEAPVARLPLSVFVPGVARAQKTELMVSKEQRQVLAVIADVTNTGLPLTIKIVSDYAGLDRINFDHALNELQNNGLVNNYFGFEKGEMLRLTPAGIKYIIDEGIARKNESKGFGKSG